MSLIIHIPKEAIKAAAIDMALIEYSDANMWKTYTGTAEAAIRAALRAWPGMRVKAVLLADTVLLPLPQEPSDD